MGAVCVAVAASDGRIVVVARRTASATTRSKRRRGKDCD
jgi:hypothetical protein